MVDKIFSPYKVTASNLIGVNGEAQTVEGEGNVDIAASSIHLGIRKVRPDAKVIMHTHQPYATSLGEYPSIPTNPCS